MITAWLVLSRRWDVFGTPDELPIGEFLISIIIAAMELSLELYWMGKLFDWIGRLFA